jgi:hypothetical protein
MSGKRQNNPLLLAFAFDQEDRGGASKSLSEGNETGFFDPLFPTIVNRGNLGIAGLANQGTRPRARFSGVPNGVKFFARSVITNGQLVARMVNTTAAGEDAFAPVSANSFGIAPVPVNGGGGATLVYEILRADPVAGETVTAPIPRFVKETARNAFSITACVCKDGGGDDDDDHHKGGK